MAYDLSPQNISIEAGEDLSSHQYKAVKLMTDAAIDLCDTQGEFALGILQNDPESGETAAVAVAGVAKGMLGGTVAAGAEVTPGADAQFETAASGDYVCGQAIEGGDDGEIVPIRIYTGRIVA